MRLAAALLAPIAIIAAPAAAQDSPQAALDGLLAADRAFSEQAAGRDVVDGIAATFGADVVMPTRQGMVSGREAVIAALRANANYQGQHARWRPIRGGISADGQHGFTFGYLDVEGASPERAGRRYLAYWVRAPEGWRVAAYKQAIRQPGEVLREPLAPALPARLVAPSPGAVAGHVRSVSAAESAFSERAQQVGLRTAFTEFGRADAMNMGGRSGFVIGNQAIGGGFPEASTSPLHWGADRALAASSGDLAVTIGTIRPNAAPPAGQPEEIPFFTIWRRDDPSQPWRYIAE